MNQQFGGVMCGPRPNRRIADEAYDSSTANIVLQHIEPAPSVTPASCSVCSSPSGVLGSTLPSHQRPQTEPCPARQRCDPDEGNSASFSIAGHASGGHRDSVRKTMRWWRRRQDMPGSGCACAPPRSTSLAAAAGNSGRVRCDDSRTPAVHTSRRVRLFVVVVFWLHSCVAVLRDDGVLDGQATFGKQLFGLRVTDDIDGDRRGFDPAIAARLCEGWVPPVAGLRVRPDMIQRPQAGAA